MTEPQFPAVQNPGSSAPMIGAVQDVKAQVKAIHHLLGQVMKKGTHYGVIPGTGDKPTLLKAGAEKIGLLLRLAPSFKRETQWDGSHMTVLSECILTSITTGAVIATAGAMCSTRETKYAYRQTTRKCPSCNKPAIIKGKAEYGGGWVCFTKKDGCGAKFPDDDPRMTGQSGEREENPNLPDTYNTVLKMADKRAYVAATLFGTAASDIFTQDIEDFGPDPDPPPPPPPPPPAKKSAQKRDAKGNLIAPKIPEGMPLAKKLHDGYFKAASEEVDPATYHDEEGANITAQITDDAEIEVARGVYYYWREAFKESEEKREPLEGAQE